jgi:hypothetical protein
MEIGKSFLELVTQPEEILADNSNVENTPETIQEVTASEANTDTDIPAEEVVIPNTEVTNIEDDNEYGDDFQKKIIDFLRVKKNREVTSIDDLLKDPEVKEIEKIVEKNPYENLKPEVKAFLDYHADTNRSYEDYQRSQQDISTVADIELARQRVLEETGQELTNEDIDAYLERSLNIDLSDISELDKTDKIALSAYTRAFREQKVKDQEKYKVRIEEQKPNQEDANLVTLEDGRKIPKDEYDNLVSQRNEYLETIKKASDNINASKFQIDFDDAGSKVKLDFAYDFSVDDKRNTLSMAEDLNATVAKLFRTEEGFNHQEFLESLNWFDPKTRGKMVSSLLNKAIAKATENVMKERDNVNLGTRAGLPGGSRTQTQAAQPSQSGFGVKFKI